MLGRVPERPKGTDCKSVVSDFGGSNPPPSTKYRRYPADVAELADAHGSGPCEGNFMGVQVPSSALESVETTVSTLLQFLRKSTLRIAINGKIKKKSRST